MLKKSHLEGFWAWKSATMRDENIWLVSSDQMLKICQTKNMKGKLLFVSYHSLISSKSLFDLDYPKICGDKVTNTRQVYCRKILQLGMTTEGEPIAVSCLLVFVL